MKLLSTMKNPPMAYRPGNYWGWQGVITPEESVRQLDELMRAGYGGVVMHARLGLEVPYFGQAWMDSVRAMIEHGKKHEFFTMIDDEEGWPSGIGHGVVPSQGEEYQLKHLTLVQGKDALSLAGNPKTLAFYRIDGKTSCRVQSPEGVPEDQLYGLYYKADPYYSENLNAKVVKLFLEAAYEPYAQEFGSEFGAGVKAFFTDEPQLARFHAPWSFILPDEYKNDHGRDILDDVPHLFLPLENHQQARYRFWKTVNRLFAHNYAKQIDDWCQARGTVLTGHVLSENHFEYMIPVSGGAMHVYQHMGLPGIDWIYRVGLTPMILKQLASVGEQCQKTRTLSEMFGAAGWGTSMAQFRWIADAHTVGGVNYPLQHFGQYSMKGSRKRECPAVLSYQAPYWDAYKSFTDHCARMNTLLCESKALTDTLVLSPLATGWMVYVADGSHTDVKKLDEDYTQLLNTLWNAGVDYHIGDESIMADIGRVDDGKLWVGAQSYRNVVIPESMSLETTTLALLQGLQATDGSVFTLGQTPDRLSGEPSQELMRFVAQLPHFPQTRLGLESLAAALDKPFVWQVVSGPELWGSVRENEDGLIYMLYNPSETDDSTFLISDAQGLYRIDLTNCTLEELPSPMVLPAMGSAALIRPRTAPETVRPAGLALQPLPTGNTLPLSGNWTVKCHTPNILLLDQCAFQLDGGPWQPETDILALQDMLLRGKKNCDVAMRFTFMSTVAPTGALHLVLECPEKCQVTVNGQTPQPDAGWWMDQSFRKLPIDGLIQKGQNEIVVSRRFECSEYTYNTKNNHEIHEAEHNRVTVETELEALMILGEFGVDPTGTCRQGKQNSLYLPPNFTMVSFPTEVAADHLEQRGFAFFAGNMALEKTFTLPQGIPKRVTLAFHRQESSFVEISVNGSPKAMLMWAPTALDITPWVKPGENTVEMTLWSDNRNLMGPHHTTHGELDSVTANNYYDTETYTPEYCMLPWGMPGARLIIE